MAAEVPLKIRVEIRDLWDSPKSHVHEAIEALQGTLGHKIIPQVQWSLLWDELKDRFPDKTTFVPTICRITIAWYERLLWRLDSENFPEWTEEVLGLLAQSGGTKYLHIEPSPPPHVRPKTLWRANTASFYLGIPKTEPAPQAKIVAAFDQDFENLLTSSNAAPVAEEGWEDAAEPGPAAATAPRRTVTTHAVPVDFEAKPKMDRLPEVNEIPRPPELFKSAGPYIMTVDVGNGKIVIKCSHEPSLELISAYFNKWGKQNVNDNMRRNMFKVHLTESTICNGVMDGLLIESYSHYVGEMNPTLFLAFIEGVLGYKMIHTNGHNWVYKSDTIFK